MKGFRVLPKDTPHIKLGFSLLTLLHYLDVKSSLNLSALYVKKRLEVIEYKTGGKRG